MKISYKKLWHLLIDRGLNKQDLRRMTGISTASIAKLGKQGREHYNRHTGKNL